MHRVIKWKAKKNYYQVCRNSAQIVKEQQQQSWINVENNNKPLSALNYQQFSSFIATGNIIKADELLRSFTVQEKASIRTPVFNSLIRAWVQKKDIKRAFEVFEILLQSHAPNEKTITTLINASLLHKQEMHRLPFLSKILQEYEISPGKLLLSQRNYRLDTTATLDPNVAIKLSPNQSFIFDPYERQLKQEQNSLDERISFYQQLSKGISTSQKKQGTTLKDSEIFILRWFNSLSASIEKERNLLTRTSTKTENQENNKVLDIMHNEEINEKMIKYLNEFSPNKLALITIEESLQQLLHSPSGVRFTNLVISIGTALESQLYYQNINSIINKKPARFLLNSLHYENMRTTLDKEEPWSSAFIATLGGWLINILINSTTLMNGKTRPFYHAYQNQNGKRYGVIHLHSSIYKIIDVKEILNYNIKNLPMVVPPRKWKGVKNGAYLLSSPCIVKTPSTSHLRMLKSSNLSKVYSIVDILSSVPWRINKKILQILEKVMDNPNQLQILNLEEKYNLSKSNKSSTNYNNFMNIFLIAQKFKNEPNVYFPHNMDFRGRCYPIPSFLNHMGSDLCRGLLQFSKGVKLGDHGVHWMKIHLANLFGKNKLTFDDRISFIDNNINNVFDSAFNPFETNWWQEAEKPWQCLSTCMELVDCLLLDDPSEYISYSPIHVDGSCNGLQHYAALGGDLDGAKSVNLLPFNSPQDVYSKVLNEVIKRIEIDSTIENSPARLIFGKITRSTVKQTVMTFVYGVTIPGATRQIRTQLEKLDIHQDDLSNVSEYLTQITFQSMENLFTNAREIMNWLSECARVVGRRGNPISWKTPFGFPVEQPYRRAGKYSIKTSLQQIVLVSDNSEDFPVFVQKQKAAFPPNFIHSLDSTHMLHTANQCNNYDITFAAVHDSFWTHAGSIDLMNKILRDSFVKLHETPLLENLTSQLKGQYPDLQVKPIPQKGPLNLEFIKNSKYFFH